MDSSYLMLACLVSVEMTICSRIACFCTGAYSGVVQCLCSLMVVFPSYQAPSPPVACLLQNGSLPKSQQTTPQHKSNAGRKRKSTAHEDQLVHVSIYGYKW